MASSCTKFDSFEQMSVSLFFTDGDCYEMHEYVKEVLKLPSHRCVFA